MLRNTYSSQIDNICFQLRYDLDSSVTGMNEKTAYDEDSLLAG